MTTYISANAGQMNAWIRSGLCAFCGSSKGKESDSCFCRYCDSCSEYWLADVRRDLNDGRPRMEVCPDCAAEGY